MEDNNSKRGQLKAIVLLLIGFIIGFATHAFTVSKEGVILNDDTTEINVECVFPFARITEGTDGGAVNDDIFTADISAEGRYVTFESGATNLVAGDDNGAMDVFVFDRHTGETAQMGCNQ